MKRRDLLQIILFGLPVSVSLFPVYSVELSDEIISADVLFKKNEFAQSLEAYKKIRNKSINKNFGVEWKYCTLQIIRCSRRLCDLLIASEEYFQYCRVDSLAPLELAPVIWQVSSAFIHGSKPDPQASFNILRQIANSNSNPAAELLAASILAASQENSLRNIGLHHLRKLANPQDNATENTNKTDNKNITNNRLANIKPQHAEALKKLTHEVMLLSGVLLWKERIPILRNEKDIAAMRRLLEQVPEVLRAGAFFLFGKAAAQIGLLEEAVIEIMKIPVQYPEDASLVLDSLTEAAKILDKLNRKNQAEQLRSEAKELITKCKF
ncbi:MAG: hypothetical protein LBP59_05935 [Planctomycetaceae bacterium]|jgi:tetratricopeptide (TPR) repeat protein|nr:hypothetical protein [Planctomycetaceae bacterium]